MNFVVYYEFDNYVFLLGFSIYDLLILKLIIEGNNSMWKLKYCK